MEKRRKHFSGKNAGWLPVSLVKANFSAARFLVIGLIGLVIWIAEMVLMFSADEQVHKCLGGINLAFHFILLIRR
jgi:hypothetical protein